MSDLKEYFVGLLWENEEGIEDYATTRIFALNARDAVYSAQIDMLEGIQETYLTRFGGAYTSVQLGEDEDHGELLDQIFFRIAFVSDLDDGSMTADKDSLGNWEIWGAYEGSELQAMLTDSGLTQEITKTFGGES